MSVIAITHRLSGIEACVFDAYGTLFDVNSAAHGAKDRIGEKWQPLAELRRAKQLQYTWLRALTGHYADFLQVTGDALDFALASLRIEPEGLREYLMSSYLQLKAYPEVVDALTRLKAAHMKTAILSNGTPAMLAAAVASAGIAPLFDAVLSVDQVRMYKPHPSVYRLASERLGIHAASICFVSANGWDAHSAKAFGMRVLWCNRSNQAPERIPDTPDAQIVSLAEVPGIVLADGPEVQ